jgi:hypothetical protein
MSKKTVRRRGGLSQPADRDSVRSTIVDAIRAEIARGSGLAEGPFTKDVYSKAGHEKGSGNPFEKDVYSKEGYSKGVGHEKNASIPGRPGAPGRPAPGGPGGGRGPRPQPGGRGPLPQPGGGVSPRPPRGRRGGGGQGPDD